MEDDDLPITGVMVMAATRLPAGADILYHLAKHQPDELRRIATLPDIEQAWEIKALESKLAAPPKVTTTPPPIVPSGRNTPTKKEWKDMSTAEHVDAWHKRKR
jgi:hypothetical protein